MNRAKIFAMAAVLSVLLSGCGSDQQFKTNMESQKYGPDDLHFATNYINEDFGKLGYVLDEVDYLGDSDCGEGKVNMINKIFDTKYTDCMGFSFDAHDSRSPVWIVKNLVSGRGIRLGGLDDQLIWFARTDDGEWEKVWEGEIE